jgi:hypothetical protein
VTIPADCARVMLRFNLDTVDVAIFGFHMHRNHTLGDTVDWARDVNDIATAVRDSWVAHMTHGNFGTAVIGDRVDVYHLGTDGRTIDKGTAGFTVPNDWRGSQGVSLPWETSLAVTLYGYEPGSFTPQAARKRGRFYLPPMATNAMDSPSGGLGTSVRASLDANLAAFFGDVKTITLHDYGEIARDTMKLGILSRRGSIFTDAVAWGYDDRFDVQRRRENRQAPARYTHDL